MVTIYRILKFAWQGFWRNFWLSLATITIIILTLISVNFLIIINYVAESAVKSVNEKIDVSIYFKNDTLEKDIIEVKDYLSAHSKIKEIKYKSAQDALQDFRNKHKNDLTILESLEELGENPLGGTLIIKADSAKDYKSIEEIIDNSKYKDIITSRSFEDNENFINIINDISRRINNTGFIITALFVLIAILIVFNTIRMAIYTQREEIAIMKLVGANNSYITTPFLIESVMYALLGATLCLSILFPIFDFIQPFLTDFFKGTEINVVNYYNENLFLFIGIELAGTIVLCIVSSYIAIRRYLRV